MTTFVRTPAPTATALDCARRDLAQVDERLADVVTEFDAALDAGEPLFLLVRRERDVAAFTRRRAAAQAAVDRALTGAHR